MFLGTVVSSRSVFFSWQPPLPEEANGVIVGYTVNITEAGSGEIIQRTVPGMQTSLSVSTLSPFTTYLCFIAASTSVSIGPFSTTLTINTPEDSEKTVFLYPISVIFLHQVLACLRLTSLDLLRILLPLC